MKIFNILSKSTWVVLFLTIVFAGCKESGDLIIDPVGRDTLFTFSPSHGYPGTTVLISGKGLSNVNKVAFGSTEGVIISQSDNGISAAVPVGAKTGRIKLINASGLYTSLTDFTVDDTPVPTVISFDPAIAGSGDVITVTGNLFDKVDSVYIGSLKAEIQADRTPSLMKIVAPSGLKSGNINLYYNYMTNYGMEKVAVSKSDKVVSLALPVISSITPDISALNIGQQVVIKGSMLDRVTQVKFADKLTSGNLISGDTMLTVLVPAGVSTGKITLITRDGTLENNSNFQIILPAITMFDPFKGSSSAGIRSVYVSGTKLDLVDSVLIGSTKITVENRNSTGLMLKFPGNLGGFIKLYSKNGVVTSTIPFIITGDAWLTDGTDHVFDPIRLNAIYSNETTSPTDKIMEGGPFGKYHQLGGTTNGNKTRTYITGKGAGEDIFMLYTPNPADVTFSFDMSYEQLPANFINTDGSVVIQIFSFTSGDKIPYGFHKNVTIPFTSPGNWQHVSVNLADLVEANSSSLIGATPGKATANKVKPNKMRIMGIVFINNPAAGQPINWNIDNVKFSIN